MKLFILSCVLVGVLAEPPRYRPARFRLQRQQLAPTTTESPTEPTTEAETPYPPAGVPYPPSGWKPTGQAFTLPNPKVETPASTYGTPADQKNGPYPPSGWKPEGQPFTLPQTPPATSYGVPDNAYGAPSTAVLDVEPTDNPQAEKLEGPIEVAKSVGTYYVLLPNGQLQKVDFVTEDDIQNMKYTARLQLRERAPLLVFGP